ncbi:MAG: SsrA-binding protein SmpB [Oscillospiraceae bacterium]|nr:SsrA-binding protein SmpB [Oscillospiraceae bacterium]
MAGPSKRLIAQNKKAFHDYFVETRFEAGIELAGTEGKSIRKGNVNLKDSFCIVKDGEIRIYGMHISPYEQGNIFNKDPMRPRRLLMHKREILRLFAKVKQDGYAIVPLSLYFLGPRVKLEIGLCKGKKLYDKRDAAAAKDARREIDQAMKSKLRA